MFAENTFSCASFARMLASTHSLVLSCRTIRRGGCTCLRALGLRGAVEVRKGATESIGVTPEDLVAVCTVAVSRCWYLRVGCWREGMGALWISKGGAWDGDMVMKEGREGT